MSASPGPSGGATLRRWKPSAWTVMSVVVGVVGASVLFYPSASAWVSQYHQSQVIVDYAKSLQSVDPEPQEQLRAAREYNRQLSVGALLGENARIPEGTGTSGSGLAYRDLLMAPNGVMGRLQYPDIGVDLPIRHGTDDATLLEGLGHLEGTSLPVGGKGMHSVVTGHRGLASAAMLTNLDDAEVGDVFSVEVFGEAFHYEVRTVRSIEPDDTESLRAEEGRDLLTLVTCTPLGLNTHRLLVTAERVDAPAGSQEPGAEPVVPGFPWWAVVYAAALGLFGVYLWRGGLLPVPDDSAAEAPGEGRDAP